MMESVLEKFMNTSLEVLAQQEPWRQNVGAPANALDPTWSPSVYDLHCDGDIEFEGTTRWWFCTKCGYIGLSSFLRHKPPQHPITFLLNGLALFVQRRTVRPTPPPLRTVIHQMAFIAGVALRYAAVQPPEELSQYVRRMTA